MTLEYFICKICLLKLPLDWESEQLNKTCKKCNGEEDE